MARIAKIQSNEKRKRLSKKYSARRAELRKVMKDQNASEEEKATAQMRLQKLPRNSAKERVRNRCEVTGRPRAFLRTFRLSRIAFRELALQGMIPGVTKSSW